MRWLMWMGVAASLVGLAPMETRAQLTAPTHPLEYGVFALDFMQLGRKARIAGAVGVNEGEARIGRRSAIEGVIAADTIRLGRRVQSEGITCTLVVGGKEPCVPLVGSLVPQSALELVRVDPGAADVVVPRGARRVALSPGSYRKMRIGRGSSLTLAGGEYDFRSVKISSRATLACAASCRIRVTRKVVLGRRGVIGRPDVADPALLRIDIEGKRSRTAVRIGSRAKIVGTLYAPVSNARFGRRVRVIGGIVVGELRAGSRLRVDRP